MFRRAFMAVLACVALAGCATSIMDGYVGKPLESAMARYGPPTNVFDLPDGRRAFQWQMNSSFVVPGSATTYGSANIYAPPGAFARVNTQSTTTYMPAQAYTQQCLYTMYAQFNGSGWVFVGYEKPPLACY